MAYCKKFEGINAYAFILSKLLDYQTVGLMIFKLQVKELEILMHFAHHFQSLGLQLQLPKSKTTKPISHG